MIMLPLQVKNTAFLQLQYQWAGHISKTDKKNIFVKHADMKILPNYSKEINVQTHNTT